MNVKKIEKSVTWAGVVLLTIMTIVGCIGCVNLFCDSNLFESPRYHVGHGDVLDAIVGILLVCILGCCLVATMINISRIANSLERISEKGNKLLH